MRDWQRLLQSEGYAVGMANPALFSNRQRNSRGAVHGDDFYVLANRVAIDHIGIVLPSKYKVRERHRLRFGKRCTRAAVASEQNRCTWVRVKDADSFRSTQTHDTFN